MYLFGQGKGLKSPTWNIVFARLDLGQKGDVNALANFLKLRDTLSVKLLNL